MLILFYKGKVGVNLESWLYKKDEYIPKEDEDRFIDKSIFSIFNILSMIKRDNRISRNKIYGISSAVKILFTLILILVMSISNNFIYILIINSYLLLYLSLLDKEDIKKIIIVSTFIPLFTLIMLIPSIIFGNYFNSILLSIKILGTVISINILSYTTKWYHITKSLKLFRVPDLFIFILELTIKYIYTLGGISISMLYALKLRSVGKNNKKYYSLSKTIGSLFLKSKDMSEEVYSAMICRGFTGEYTSYPKLNICKIDVIYIMVNVFVILSYFFVRV